MRTAQTSRRVTIALSVVLSVTASGNVSAADPSDSGIIDLSLMVSAELPCTWTGGWPYFQLNPYQRIGRRWAYNSDILTIDTNTGTQLDVPAHSVPRPGLPEGAPFGAVFSEKVPAWQYGGEACVIDCRSFLDNAPNGRSPLITKAFVMGWEKNHRPLGPGDVVIFYSGYCDNYYKPFPAGRRFLAETLENQAPAWPDPDPECMEYVALRKVMHVVTDSPSMGPYPVLGEPTHFAGLKHGLIFTEAVQGVGQLPATGSFYCATGPKHTNCPGSEGRAFSVVDEALAKTLIDSVRKKNVIDLSVTLAADLPVTWTGHGVGHHRQPYMQVQFMYMPRLDYFQKLHILDSHAGTHLVPPAFALPDEGFDRSGYADDVQAWLAEYEAKYGAPGTSDVTTEKVPLSQTCGWARVVDVRSLVGSTHKVTWPNSPEITVAHLKAYEEKQGKFTPGQIVLFQSGHTDRTFSRESQTCMVEPLQGKTEGWPAPGADAIVYLAERGILCVGTDGPSLGGVDRKRALFTYWALASRGMVAVEMLTKLADVPKKAYFVFAPVKIRGCHGGPGRALAYY